MPRTTPAEAALKQEATKPQYSLTLLTIVSSDSIPANTRLSAALAFKNFIRLNYVVSLDAAPCRAADIARDDPFPNDHYRRDAKAGAHRTRMETTRFRWTRSRRLRSASSG